MQDRLVKLSYPAAFDNAGSLLLNDPKCRQHCIREAVKLFQKGSSSGGPRRDDELGRSDRPKSGHGRHDFSLPESRQAGTPQSENGVGGACPRADAPAPNLPLPLLGAFPPSRESAPHEHDRPHEWMAARAPRSVILRHLLNLVYRGEELFGAHQKFSPRETTFVAKKAPVRFAMRTG